MHAACIEHGPSYHVRVPLKPMKAQFSSPDPAPEPPQSLGSPGCQWRYDEVHVGPSHASQWAAEPPVVTVWRRPIQTQLRWEVKPHEPLLVPARVTRALFSASLATQGSVACSPRQRAMHWAGVPVDERRL